MKVDCTSDHALTLAEMSAVLASCWPDFTVQQEDIEPLSSSGEAWRVPVPSPLAARISGGEQGSKWQNGATVPVDDQLTTVMLTFDPGTATED